MTIVIKLREKQENMEKKWKVNYEKYNVIKIEVKKYFIKSGRKAIA